MPNLQNSKESKGAMPDVIRLCPFCGANLNLCAPLFGCCSEGAVCEGEEGLGNSVQEPLFVHICFMLLLVFSSFI